jgi:hypothetical protein
MSSERWPCNRHTHTHTDTHTHLCLWYSILQTIHSSHSSLSLAESLCIDVSLSASLAV